MDIEEVKRAIRDIETDAVHQDRFYYKKCMEFLVGEIEGLRAANKSWMDALLEAFK